MGVCFAARWDEVSSFYFILWLYCALFIYCPLWCRAAVVVAVPFCLLTLSTGWTLTGCCSDAALPSSASSLSTSRSVPPFCPFLSSSLPLSPFFLSVALPQVWRLLWLVLLVERWLTVWLSFWLPWCLSAHLAALELPPQGPCWGIYPTRGVKAYPLALGRHAAPGTPRDHPAREPQRTTQRIPKLSDPSKPTL